jgi:hypothetical protein
MEAQLETQKQKEMKVLNYVICSTIIFVGILLLSSGEIIPSISGLIWFVVNMKFSCLNIGRKMWKRYWKTNMELNRYFGLE